MSIFEAIKEAISIAQKVDNIDLYHKLLEVSSQALELQNKVSELTEANWKLKHKIEELQKASDIEEDIELLPGGFLIRRSEKEQGKNIHYCAACWQKHKKLMPYVRSIGGAKQCNNCHSVLR